ncbi:MAG: ABC transporter ATP-binding protein [Desulforhopalus sp.]
MPLLETRNLEVKMGLQQILFGVSVKVEENSIVAVLGANGVGKTTLMRAVSGMYRVAGGSVHFMGQDITNLRTHKTTALGIGQAPEGRQIFANMTILENLQMGAYHQPKVHFDKDLQMVYEMFPILAERRRQQAGSLSGGEQQMLTIGRALMGRPKLLLMDEPSLGLAPMLVKQIFDMICLIRRQGTAILLVEQNARAALSVADYGYILESGKVVLEGPSKNLQAEERVAAAYMGGHVQ